MANNWDHFTLNVLIHDKCFLYVLSHSHNVMLLWILWNSDVVINLLKHGCRFYGKFDGLAYLYANQNLFWCFRTFIGNPVHYDAKMTCDELAGKVRTNFQLCSYVYQFNSWSDLGTFLEVNSICKFCRVKCAVSDWKCCLLRTKQW